MKKELFILLAAVFFISSTISAQVVSKDSINTLKDEKKIIELTGEINTQKLKLADLENSLTNKLKEKEKQTNQAQEYADANSKVASDLSDNPNNKKLARKAKTAAKNAKKQGKQARRSDNSLKGLENDIESLKNSIESNEKKLAAQQSVE